MDREEEQKIIEEDMKDLEPKPVILDKDTTIVVNMPLPSVKGQMQVKKMLEAISIKKEETKKALIEQNNINEIDLKALLSKENYEFYQEKKYVYLEAYPDLTDPFDLDDLDLMIMEQILRRDLWKRKKKYPTIDISKDYENSVKRQLELKKSLSLRRTDRVKEKGQTKQTLNISNLSLHFSDKNNMDKMELELRKERAEEDKLRSIDSKVIE